MAAKRRKTRVIRVGNVKIGGNNPVSIQSMAKSDTRDIKNTVSEIKRLEGAGCEIIRVAVKDMGSASAIKTIKRKIKIPLVADIHFDFRLALAAIKNGADKIRINPGNMPDENRIADIIKAAKKRKIPIRIGLNSGSLGKTVRSTGSVDRFIQTAVKYIKIFEKERFRDIIISLKSSDVKETIDSYRNLAALCDYPFHLGVTAAGPYESGAVKSSIGIGALLLDGIGDTIRVSLTGDAVSEVLAGKRILEALKLRNFGPEIISCPTCGRCQVDLVKIVRDFEHAIRTTDDARRKAPIRVALMGCEVNGPGEAREADIGIAFGKDSGIIFKKSKVVKKVTVKNAVKELFKLI